MFARANCTIISPEHVDEYDCPIRNEPRNRGNYISGYIIFKQDIPKLTLELRVQMPSLKSPASNTTEFFKFRLNGCQVSSYKNSNPIVTAVLKKLKSGGNFNGCPLKAVGSLFYFVVKVKSILPNFQNKNYTVRYFALNPDYFPPFTPEITFAATLNLYIEKTHLIAANIVAKLVKKNAKSH